MKKISTLFAFYFTSLLCQAQWTVENSGFSAANMEVFSISAPSASTVWASAYDTAATATFNGDYTRTINGGTTWIPGTVTGASGYDISSIIALDQINAWVIMNDVNSGGAVIKNTANGGATWTAQTIASQFQAPDGYGDDIYFWNANEGVAVGDSNGGYWEIYTTSNAGVTWTRVPQLNIPANLIGEGGNDNVHAVVGNTIWFGTNKGRIYKSTDKGLNWTVSQSSLGNVFQMAFKDANNGLISNGSTTALLKTTDGGTTWTSVPFVGNIFDLGLCFAAGSPSAYFSTGNGGSSYSMDNGLNWITLDQVNHSTVAFFNSTTGWSGGWNTSSTVGGMFKFSGTLGINDITNKGNVKVFPNPMDETAFVSLSRDPVNAELVLTDISGQVVLRIENISSKEVAIHRNDLSAGLYLFTVTDEKSVIGTGKLIVK